MGLPAQLLTLGLDRHWPRSERAARELGQRLGATQIWYALREIAGPVTDGAEALSAIGALILETIARTLPPIGENLLQTTRRQAPPHWRPPADVGAHCHVEDWWLTEMVFAGGSFECLRGHPYGHPYIAPTDLLRSSPLVWIDVGLGWAQAESRLYRLGRPAVDRLSSC